MIGNGHTVLKPKSTEHDRIIKLNGSDEEIKIEIKGSFLWGTGTHFRYQQIRTHQDYDYIVFLAVYPENIKLYVASKEVAKNALEVQDENGKWIHNQHGGKDVNSGTFFIDCIPSEIDWIEDLEW
jgi:hypothetical protein